MSTLLQAFLDTPEEKRVHVGSGAHRYVWSVPHIAGIVFKTVRDKEYGPRANLAEMRLWDYLTSELEWADHASWLVPVVAGAEDGSIVAMLRATPYHRVANQIVNHVHFAHPAWMQDSHDANLGWFQDNIVQLDYGLFYHMRLPKPSPQHKRASTKTFPLPAW